MAQLALVAGSVSALLAVVLGAFGAHALKARLAPELLVAFTTGVHYQMFHALALLLTGLLLLQVPFRDAASLGWAVRFFLLGSVLFCGSLYLLATMGWRWLGPITPLGGVSFIVAWGLLAYGVCTTTLQ